MPFAPWESAKADGIEKRYTRVGNSLLSHDACRSLGDKAFRVYVHMKMESGGKREFTLPYTKAMGIMDVSKGGYKKAVDELCEKGFIDVVEKNANLRKANVYCFSQRWKEEQTGT